MEGKRGLTAILLLLLHRIRCHHVEGTSSSSSSTDEKVEGGKMETTPTRSLVIGGFDATPGRFPYGQVSLFRRNRNHQCGGTVVAPDMILTAGHCRDVFDTVEIGEYNRQNNNENKNNPAINRATVQTFQPVRKIRHPEFEEAFFRYDVLLVKLDRPVENVEPVRLNSNRYVPRQSSSSSLTLIGWGSTNYVKESGDRIFPSVLQQASVPYVNNYACERSEYNGQQLYRNEIFDEMLCAGRTDVDACRGDSGSPLIQEGSYYDDGDDDDVLMGLVSWGRGCGRYPGVYARISAVFPWIRARVCRHSASPPSYLACRPDEQSPETPGEESPPSLSPSPSLELTGSSQQEEPIAQTSLAGSDESDLVDTDQVSLPDYVGNEDSSSSNTSARQSAAASLLFWVLPSSLLSIQLWLRR